MDHLFLARQPILDRTKTVVGYELLHRGGFLPKANFDDAEAATAHVALSALTEIGLDRLVGDHVAWINVTRDFLLRDLVRSLPAERIVLELLEHQLVDRQLLNVIAELRASGYVFALDDFAFEAGSEQLLEHVDFVKLDLLDLGPDGLARQVELLARFDVKMLAEKVETPEHYDLGLRVGCDLFQGYFFCRPELIRNRAISANGVAMARLASVLQDPTLQLGELERLISSDVALSYRLLRYINSAYFGMSQRISSIMHAVALLGLQNVKQWALLTTFAAIENKPPELFLTALIRARFCELAGTPQDGGPQERFTLGLFSVLDALLDTEMETAVALLPLPPRMREALIAHNGPGRLLDCVQAIEQGNFSPLVRQLDHATRHYVAALAWADDTSRGLLHDTRRRVA
jgi:EAL and modified HD-GYP domain-containing signal transduction protein